MDAMAISNVSSLVSNGVGSGAAAVAQAENTQKSVVDELSRRSDSSSSTQLSALGRTKLSLEELQNSAQAAQGVGASSTQSEFRNAVQGIVQSLNALGTAVRQATPETTQSGQNAPTDPRSTQALDQVRNALQEDGGRALQQLGVAQDAQGTFSINQRRLEAAFEDNRQASLAALSDVAERVERAAAQGLDETTNPSVRNEAPRPQAASQPTPVEQEERTRAAQRESFREQLAAQLANTRNYAERNAVATYFSVATL